MRRIIFSVENIPYEQRASAALDQSVEYEVKAIEALQGGHTKNADRYLDQAHLAVSRALVYATLAQLPEK